VAVSPFEIIARIRSFLSGLDQTDSPEFRALANEYSTLMRSLERRLRRVGELAGEGHFDAAIDAAEEVPPLREALNAVGFLERNEWHQLLRLYDVSVATFDVEAQFEQLGLLYEKRQSLSGLMRNYRKANLRGDMREKLRLLHAIYQLDGDNPQWRRDIVEHERYFLQQLRDRLGRMGGTLENYPQLAEVKEALESTEWTSASPGSLLRDAERKYAASLRQRILNRGEAIANQMTEAFSARDAVGCHPLVEQWRSWSGEHPNEAEMIRGGIEDALEWYEDIEEERRREQMCQHMVAVIQTELEEDRPNERAVLESYARLRDMNYPIEASLVKRLRNFQERVETQKQRKFIIKIGAVLAAMVVVAVALALISLSIQARRAREAFLAQASRNVELGNHQQALEDYADFSRDRPSVAAHPNVVKYMKNVEILMTQERQRRSRFEEIRERLKSMTLEPGIAEILARAKALGTTDEEKLWVEDYEMKWDERKAAQRAAVQKSIDEEYIRLKRGLEVLCLKAQKALKAGRNSARAFGEVDKDITRGRGILAEMARIKASEMLIAQLPAFRLRLKALQDASFAARRQIEKVSAAREVVEGRWSSAEDFRKASEVLLSELPLYEKVRSQEPWLNAVVNWRKEAKSAEATKALKGYLDGQKDSVHPMFANLYELAVMDVGLRVALADELDQGLGEFLKDVSTLYVAKNDKETILFVGEPEITKIDIRGEALLEKDYTRKKIMLPRSKGYLVRYAPIARAAKETLAIAQKEICGRGHNALLRGAALVLGAKQECKLKEDLVGKLLKLSEAQAHAPAALKALQQLCADRSKKPGVSQAQLAARLAALSKMLEQCDCEWALVDNMLTCRYSWIGYYAGAADAENEFVIRYFADAGVVASRRDLFAFFESKKSGRLVPLRIGRLSNPRARVETGVRSLLAPGQLVYTCAQSLLPPEKRKPPAGALPELKEPWQFLKPEDVRALKIP